MKRARNLISPAVFGGSTHSSLSLLSSLSVRLRTFVSIFMHLKILSVNSNLRNASFSSKNVGNFRLHKNSLQRCIHTSNKCVAFSIPMPDRRFLRYGQNVCLWWRLMFSSTIEQCRRTKCSTVCWICRVAEKKRLDNLTREAGWRRVRLSTPSIQPRHIDRKVHSTTFQRFHPTP